MPRLQVLLIWILFLSSSRVDALTQHQNPSRRAFVKQGGVSLIGLATFSSTASADETPVTTTSKPFAPVEALLPAARCKIWIDRAVSFAAALPNSKDDPEKQYQTLSDLNQILSNRPKLFRKNEKSSSRSIATSTAQITTSVSRSNKEQYQEYRQTLNFPNQVAALLNQADVERQWGMLKYEQSKKDSESEVRAALNYYTQQLQFGDRYLLTASKNDRKQMIRNDALPSLTAVITSDLDLRDLYRNQLLTALDDATAEVAYQVKQSPSKIEITDVMELMSLASTALNKWFGLIETRDVEEAMSASQL